MDVIEKESKRTAMYLKKVTRDRINLLKARYSLVVGRPLTQDETLAILFDTWDTAHDDGEVAALVGGPRQ